MYIPPVLQGRFQPYEVIAGTSEVQEFDVIEGFSDSDWSGEAKDRRSTTSGMVFCNSLLVLNFSRTQKSTALSSCEAELYALSAVASETLYNWVNVEIPNRETSSS